MATTREIINEIKELRGSEVYYWGSKHKMPSEVDDYTVDICDILEALEPYELPEDLTKVEENELDWDTSEFDVVVDRLAELGYIENTDNYKGDNSYNWSAPVSNHYDTKIWDNGDNLIVALMVHRYGDVRGNYTGHAWYRFEDRFELDEAFYEAGTKSNMVEFQGKTYYCDIDIFTDGIRVTEESDSWNEFYIYEYIETDEEMIQAIKEKIGFQTWLEQCTELIKRNIA